MDVLVESEGTVAISVAVDSLEYLTEVVLCVDGVESRRVLEEIADMRKLEEAFGGDLLDGGREDSGLCSQDEDEKTTQTDAHSKQ